MRKKEFKPLFILLFCLFIGQNGFATHYRAGEILYEYLAPQTYRVTVVTYSEIGGGSAAADQDSILLNWGDGTTEGILRVNGALGASGIPNGEVLAGTIKKNVYRSKVHTYPGALPYYVVSITEQNRIAGIVNIAGGTGSVNVPFYLEDTLRYLPPELFAGNSSPILLNPPIDYANILDTFYHNPNAFDPDGDSLHYSLVPSFQAVGVEVPQYTMPDLHPPGINNNISINPLTGELIWAVPQIPGEYNVAIRIREYRNGLFIGTLLRDMQILVGEEPNDPPQIKPINDTCIYAGDTLQLHIVATDPNAGDIVTLSANGAPFQIDASRVDFSPTVGNPATATFQWNTICSDIRPTAYSIVFKAEDNHTTAGGNLTPLVDLETWLVKVVPPPPDSLQAMVNSNDVLLTWDSVYQCAGDPNFQYFSVWRKYGCENIGRNGCATGLANTGYEMIADNITDYNYLDQNVDRGHIYSYRILAHFGVKPTSSSGSLYNVQQSIPSAEVCVELPLDLPVITNVSVDTTHQSIGRMFVQWSKPHAGAGLLDTLQDLPPYTYQLFRSEGFVGANFSLIHSATANSYTAFNDTLYYDSLLNTLEKPYSYKVVFKAQNQADSLGESSTASSIYLSVGASDQSLVLSWQENVPWVNEFFTIYRLNNTTLFYDSIATTTAHNYTDTSLVNGETYCYKIRSTGKYFSQGLIEPIINFSEINCGIPIDTVAPCAPKLQIKNDCENVNEVWTNENYQNRLQWTIDNTCAADAVSYKVYYKAMGESIYSLLIETNELNYIHQLQNSIAGCYYVTAIDDANNESTSVDTLCVENCALYVLPNVFTPNQDGSNDLFTPFPNWRFVEKIDMKIYGRWGNLVHETQNPAINWNGTDVSGKDLNDGVYFYRGFYFIRKLDGSLEKRVLPPNKRGGGFIHLMRSR